MPADLTNLRLVIPLRFMIGSVLLGVVCTSAHICLRRQPANANAFGSHSLNDAPSAIDQALKGPQEPPQQSSIPATAQACKQRADRIRSAIGGSANVAVIPPWVIVSHLSTDELEAFVEELILPFCAGVQNEYALEPLSRPVTIYLALDNAEYKGWSHRFAGCAPASPAGFFERDRRVIVLSSLRRDEALRHELTHALLADEFHYLPLWLSEGIAALHESGRIEAQSGRFLADSEGRAAPIFAALYRGELPSSQRLLDASYAQCEAELFYAHARFWCRFLHAEGSLLRALQLAAIGPCNEPLDAWQTRMLFGDRLPQDVEAEFRVWLDGQLYDNPQAASR